MTQKVFTRVDEKLNGVKFSPGLSTEVRGVTFDQRRLKTCTHNPGGILSPGWYFLLFAHCFSTFTHSGITWSGCMMGILNRDWMWIIGIGLILWFLENNFKIKVLKIIAATVGYWELPQLFIHSVLWRNKSEVERRERTNVNTRVSDTFTSVNARVLWRHKCAGSTSIKYESRPRY